MASIGSRNSRSKSKKKVGKSKEKVKLMKNATSPISTNANKRQSSLVS